MKWWGLVSLDLSCHRYRVTCTFMVLMLVLVCYSQRTSTVNSKTHVQEKQEGKKEPTRSRVINEEKQRTRKRKKKKRLSYKQSSASTTTTAAALLLASLLTARHKAPLRPSQGMDVLVECFVLSEVSISKAKPCACACTLSPLATISTSKSGQVAR